MGTRNNRRMVWDTARARGMSGACTNVVWLYSGVWTTSRKPHSRPKKGIRAGNWLDQQDSLFGVVDSSMGTVESGCRRSHS